MSKADKNLQNALQTLALHSTDQIAILDKSDCMATDFAKRYLTARGAMTRQEKLSLTPQQTAVLETMDQLLHKMIFLDEDNLWNEAGLDKNDRWIAVRERAASALLAFEWQPGTINALSKWMGKK